MEKKGLLNMQLLDCLARTNDRSQCKLELLLDKTFAMSEKIISSRNSLNASNLANSTTTNSTPGGILTLQFCLFSFFSACGNFLIPYTGVYCSFASETSKFFQKSDKKGPIHHLSLLKLYLL